MWRSSFVEVHIVEAVRSTLCVPIVHANFSILSLGGRGVQLKMKILLLRSLVVNLGRM